jgi:hypothetical protein
MKNITNCNLDTIMNFVSLNDLGSNIDPSFQFLNKPNTIIYQDVNDINIGPIRNEKLLSKISYKLNNVGQRGDDFNKLDNSKTNILFAGCSITFGHYLPENYSWPYHVYKYFKDLNIDLGPLNIVSFPGASGPKIVFNVLKYFKNYGIPDYLFILMPDIFRYYSPGKDGKSLDPVIPFTDGDSITEEINPLSRIYEFQQFYRILEIVCNLLNIKLYSTSWSSSANEIMSNFNFNTYEKVNYNDTEIVNSLDQDYLKLFDKDFYIMAADQLHAGFFPQYAYSQYFINRVKDDI